MGFLSFFYWYGARRDLHSFPTRRSSDLAVVPLSTPASSRVVRATSQAGRSSRLVGWRPAAAGWPTDATAGEARADRKSTRLNSSHVEISYAVFCLKKKKHNITQYKLTNA